MICLLPDGFSVLDDKLGFPVGADVPVVLVHHVGMIGGLMIAWKLVVRVTDAPLAVIVDLCPTVGSVLRDDTVDKADAIAAQSRQTRKARGIAVAGTSFRGEQLYGITADVVRLRRVKVDALVGVVLRHVGKAGFHFFCHGLAGTIVHQIIGGKADLFGGTADAVFVGVGIAVLL